MADKISIEVLERLCNGHSIKRVQQNESADHGIILIFDDNTFLQVGYSRGAIEFGFQGTVYAIYNDN